MLFQLVTAETGTAIHGVTFASAQEATAARPIYEVQTGRKLRIAKMTGEAWREREEALFANGTRKPLPQWWLESSWWQENQAIHADHFPHMSQTRDGMIAFTETPAKGEADIQTPISPSRYLARFFADILRTEEIAAIAARFNAGDFEVKIASTPEAFEDVYRRATQVCAENTSARSCMTGPYNHLPHHPAYVYGAGDLAIAYIEKGKEVVARAVIWPARKTFVRIYGNTKTECEALRVYLYDQKYGVADDFEGARLLKIKHRGSMYLMPYVDGEDCRGCEDDGEFFVISEDGDIEIDNTGGVSEHMGDSSRYYCRNCDDRIGRHYETYHVRGEIWCESCYENDSFYCDYTSENYPSHVGCTTVNVGRAGRLREQLWNDEAARHNAFLCEATDEYYSSHDFNKIEVITASGTQTWCDEVNAHKYFEDVNGNFYARDDFTEIEVTQEDDAREIYCLEHPAIPIFLCEACNTYHVMELQSATDASMCQACEAQGAKPQGKIEDDAQIALEV